MFLDLGHFPPAPTSLETQRTGRGHGLQSLGDTGRLMQGAVCWTGWAGGRRVGKARAAHPAEMQPELQSKRKKDSFRIRSVNTLERKEKGPCVW